MKTVFMLACMAFTIFSVSLTQAQSAPGMPDNYVVVIGAFASQSNADRFVAQARRSKLNVEVELNRIRSLYYVYVLETQDRGMAIKEATRLRGAGQYNGAWVFNGTLKELAVITQEPVKEIITPVVVEEKPKEEVKIVPPPELSREEKIKKAVEEKAMVMKKGERETLDNLYFFKDAAVLRPESRYEVDRLVQLMKKHPTEKIRIHGHTNGDEPGKIVRMKDVNADFFSVANTVEDYGSAKELSELRANVILEYLAKNGIEKNRMSIKAWGGKKPLFEVDDAKAEANVRVEIEVVQD